MKILHINVVCGIGSTGRICTDSADILAKQGHECKIAYGRETVPNKYIKNAICINSNFDVKIHGLQARLFDKAGFGSKNATKRFVKWIEKYDPDVIHLHNLHGYYVNIEVLFNYLKESKKKVVWTLHDCWAFTGHCTHFDFIGCDKWKEGCYKCPQTREYPKSYFDNSIKNYKKKKELFSSLENMMIVTPSKWLAERVKQSCLSKYSVEIINNGIDLDVFKPTESNFRERYGLKDKKIVLGVASTWDKRKGFDDFIKLADMLDDNYKIVLVGLSKMQLSILPNSILGISRTNNIKELAEIYTAADAFLNLTYEDTFPTVNLEALACGTPVITYNTGGSPECIDETCGIVIEKEDTKGLINAVHRICSKQPFSVKSCTERSKQFDKNFCYQKYNERYKDLCLRG